MADGTTSESCPTLSRSRAQYALMPIQTLWKRRRRIDGTSPCLGKQIEQNVGRSLGQHSTRPQAPRWIYDLLPQLCAFCISEFLQKAIPITGREIDCLLIVLSQAHPSEQRPYHQHGSAQSPADLSLGTPKPATETGGHPDRLGLEIVQHMPAHGEQYALRSMITFTDEITCLRGDLRKRSGVIPASRGKRSRIIPDSREKQSGAPLAINCQSAPSSRSISATRQLNSALCSVLTANCAQCKLSSGRPSSAFTTSSGKTHSASAGVIPINI
jgi:hypothetical protein